MFKLILKKQLLEIGTFYVKDRKTGARAKGSKLLLTAGLWIFCMFSLFMAGFAMSSLFGSTFFEIGLDWFYFITMGIISIFFGVFGSVFNTYASLYKAKDNDLLLSMPINTNSILSAKIFVTFLMSMIFSCIFYVPTCIYYYTHVPQSFASVLGTIVMFIGVNIFSTALVCILGYFLALASNKLQGKSYVSVVITLLFIAGYYYVYFRINKYLNYIAANGEIFAENIRGKAKLLHMFGAAFVGDTKSMLLYFVVFAAFLALVYFVLSSRYLKIMCTNKGSAKVEYVAEKAIKSKSVSSALISKELSHFTKSTIYLLNGGLGIIMMPAFALVIALRADYIKGVMAGLSTQIPGIENYYPLVIIALAMAISSTVMITAPSISLEGKNAWILKSLPVNTTDIFAAKIKTQNRLAIPAMAIFAVVTSLALGLDYSSVITVAVTSVVYMMLSSYLGLMLNLLFPNLEWKDESVPVKQGAPILIMMFGGWAFIVILGALYYFALRKIPLDPGDYVIALMVLFAVCGRLVRNWINTKGVNRWEEL
ncbi:MAG: hypothetical protein KBS43_00660 [Oscillospiraceae bacterium]|nr:hypothetical protein [Candidatus Limimonas coprohippi]